MTQITSELLGTSFRFSAAPGLFSSDRVDDGTRLLLEDLPAFEPKRVLDLGCGYGALGLPVAARYPNARCLLVDRDTLAAEYSRRNAATHALSGVEARPSLGYRDLGDERFDWVLCNVPARIGEDAIRYILGEGARLLSPGGELRVVVIRDLARVVEAIEAKERWGIRRGKEGARHVDYALGPLPPSGQVDHEAIYARDRVSVGGLELERPHDISEDPQHLRDGLPLLLELLPKKPQGRALVWRGGYGAAALTLASRGAEVLAADRDLLATAFTGRNARGHAFELSCRESFSLETLVKDDERFSLFVGEVHASAGEAANASDLLTSVKILERGGQALWMGMTRQARGWVERLNKSGSVRATAIASRGSYSVWRVEPAKRA